MTELAKRSHTNVAAVAVANKTARMAWAMMVNETDFDPAFSFALITIGINKLGKPVLRRKLNDGELVEPALVESVNFRAL